MAFDLIPRALHALRPREHFEADLPSLKPGFTAFKHWPSEVF